MKYDTEKIVAKIAEDYRRAAHALGRAHNHINGMPTDGFMTEDSMEADAEAIQGAYDAGKFEDVQEADVPTLMQKYGASDIYHLTASYFNSTGKILRVA